jgi:hypothetical protein
MNQPPAKINLRKSLPFFGLVILVVGMIVTTLAVRNNQENRQFAAYPITYPVPTAPVYTTPVPTIQPVPELCWNRVQIGENGNTYWPDGCRGSIPDPNRFCTMATVPLNMDEVNWYIAWSQGSRTVPSACYGIPTGPTATVRPTPIAIQLTPTPVPNRYEVNLQVNTGNFSFAGNQNGYYVRAYDSLDFNALIYRSGALANAADSQSWLLPPNTRLDFVTRDSIVKTSRLGDTKVRVTTSGFGVGTLEARLIDTNTGMLVDKAYVNLIAGAYWNDTNTNKPSCTLSFYKNDPTNVPPAYKLTEVTSVVKPKDTVVIAANFTNKTGKQYQKVSNHLTLGRYLKFLDTNGQNCSFNSQANTLVCDHGFFGDTGGSSMAFRATYTGSTPVPVSVFATTFANNGDTGSCSTEANSITQL